MNRIAIVCVEDESEVRDAVQRDLRPFAARFRIECAEDVADAREVMAACLADGDMPGLVLCDHVMPGIQGVDFLVELQGRAETARVRKVLLTGQAGLEDTIKAVNDAGLDHYIAKPWTAEGLQAVVRDQLTSYVLSTDLDPTPYLAVLDAARLLEALRTRASDR